MPNIAKSFILIALLWLVAGMLLGFYMGASGDTSYLDTHVAMVLPGAVVLTLYGVLYRLWPDMTSNGLARIQFWVANIGVLGLVIGAVMLKLDAGIVVVASGSALVIVAAILMAWIFWSQNDA